MPTLIEVIAKNYFSRPEVIESMRPLEQAFQKCVEKYRPQFEDIVSSLKALNDSPPSPGYEPWLVKQGVQPIYARMLARLVVRSGRRVEREGKMYSSVAQAIGFLAQPHRNRTAIAKRVRELLASQAVIANTLSDTGKSEFAFVHLLGSVAAGNWEDCPRLRDVAISLVPHFPPKRGPKVSAASAAHQMILENFGDPIKVGVYTWNDIEGTCTDPMTEATRREFSAPDFDPRPAVRRAKARARTSPNSGPRSRGGSSVQLKPTELVP